MYLTVQEYFDRSNIRDTELWVSEDEQMDGWDSNDEDVLTLCIIDASSEIDSYLRGQFLVPLVAVPDKIKRICARITTQFLSDKKNLHYEDVYKNFKDALEDLKKIKKGTIDLDLPKLAPESQTGSIHLVEGEASYLKRNLKGY